VTIEEAYNLAQERHRAGNLAEAEKIYRQILAQNPNHDPTLNMLGVMAMQAGRPDVAAEFIRQAIVARPAAADYHLNRGAALDRLGRLDDAVAEYRQALSLKADYAQALSNLGNGLRRQGKLAEAVAACRRALALSPEFAEAHHNLGLALLASGQSDAAIEALGQAVARQPRSVEFLYRLAGALLAAGRTADAVAVYRQLLSVKPILPEPWSDLGEALRKSGQIDAAVAACEQAVLLNPEYAQGHAHLGKALYEQHELDGAIEHYRRAIGLADSAEARNNLGAALHARRDWDGAIEEYQRAIAMQPAYAEAYNNLGSAFKRKGASDEAVAAFEKALELQPRYGAAHWNMAHMLLLRGEFARGWREYEWRWQTEEIKPARNLSSRPMWDGGPLQGRRILLHAEQGLGDAIHFVRYVPEVARRGGRIILAVHGELHRLLQTTWPAGSGTGAAIEQWVAPEQIPPEHDVQCALMSLPLAFQTTLETIPSRTPYLAADAEMTKQWRARLSGEKRLKVGVAWAGRRTYQRDVERSISPEKFAPLAEIPGVAWVSLQKGEAGNPPMQLLNWTEELGDMADTAALVENLDLVVSVDTAVGHLAGALGKPVWLLLPLAPDWRWMLERSDSLWYPTMRLFRQKTMGDWTSAIGEVGEALQELIDRRHDH
jgi:tetratricopeptide (TPR) repeat protein